MSASPSALLTSLAVALLAIILAALFSSTGPTLPEAPPDDSITQTTRKNRCHPKRQHHCTIFELTSVSEAQVHFAAGAQHAQWGRWEMARASFEASLQADSLTAFASSSYQNLGLVLARMGMLAESKVALHKAVEMDEESVYACYALGNSLSNSAVREDWHLAEEQYSKASLLLLLNKEEENDTNILVQVPTAHILVLRKIANRGHQSNSSKLEYAIKAREAFRPLKELIDKGKAPPSAARTAVVNLQDILRTSDAITGRSERDELLDWAVNERGIWADVRQLPRMFNPALYEVMPVKPIQPWIDNPTEQFSVLKEAESEWKTILSEYETASMRLGMRPVGQRVDFDGDLYDREAGEDWSEVAILSHADGRIQEHVSPDAAPTVMRLFRHLVPPLGTVAFSSITPGTMIKPHCGPTNEIITCHLGLVIPKHNSIKELGIIAGGEERGWKGGEWICFEDSMEHAVWNKSSETRVVLIAQLRHPLLIGESKPV